MKKTLLLCAVLVAMTGADAWATSQRMIRVGNGYESCGPVEIEYNAPDLKPGVRDNVTEMTYSIADEPYTAYRFEEVEKGVVVYQAFEFDSNSLQSYVGSKITAVNIYGGVNQNYNRNPVRDVEVFITKDLKGAPVHTQTGRLSTTSFGLNKIVFDTPYEIANDETLYIGYKFTATTLTQFFFVVDAVPTDQNSALIAFGGGDKIPQTWKNMAPETGSVCISCVLTGDNLPQNLAVPVTVTAPSVIKPGDEFNYSLTIRNRGAAQMENAKVVLKVDGEDDYTYELNKKIGAGKKSTVTIKGAPFKAQGFKNINAYIESVNGEANKLNSAKASTTSVCTETVYDRKLVMEEATGTWCGYCPAGIVMMEHLKANYDGKVCRIAVHTGDKMQASSYVPWLNANITGVPDAFLNRTINCPPTGSNILTFVDQQVDALLEAKSYIKVTLGGATISEDLSTAKLHTYVEFPIDLVHRYLLAAVVVEDGIGPYNQTNYFANNSLGEMGGWEAKDSSVPTIYEDVARDINDYPGLTGIPAQINAGLVYYNGIDVDLSSVQKDEFRAIFMILDKETGEILNADEQTIKKVGIKYVADDATAVMINSGKGFINVTGAENIAIYNVEGVKIANDSATGLRPGVYVVKADNTVRKVVVK